MSKKTAIVLTLALSAALTACGGGSGDGGTTPSAGGTRNVGTLTRSGSDLYVNGVRYDTSTAAVTIDGQPADDSQLQDGMVVSVDATTSADGTSGTASSIDYDHELEGIIDSVDVGSNSLVVMGQTILVDNATRYQGANGFTDLAVGDRVEVSGYADSNGAIHASYIERELANESEPEDVEGTVSGLNATLKTFKLNDLTVDYQNAQVSGQLSDDVYVEVEGDVAAGTGTLVATKVEVEDGDDESAGHSGEMDLEGYVTKITDSDTFEINGQPVQVNAQTRYEGKTFADIVLDAKIEVEGTVSNGVLLADEVSFE